MRYHALSAIFGDYYNQVHQVIPTNEGKEVEEEAHPMAGSLVYTYMHA